MITSSNPRASLVWVLLGTIAAAALSGIASAQPVQVLTIDGTVRDGTLLSISNDSVVIRTQTTAQSSVPIQQCLAWWRSDPLPRAVQATVRVEFHDGQRLVGPTDVLQSSDQHLTFRHADFGDIRLLPDHLRSIQLSPGNTPPLPATADLILLANGDRLEGFIVSLGREVLIEPLASPGADPIRVPLERISAMSFITPAKRPVSPRVRLADESLVEVGRILYGDDGLFRLQDVALSQSGQTFLVDSGSVEGVLCSPNSLLPLSSLSPTQVSAPPYRLRAPAPSIDRTHEILGLADIHLSGPLTIDYELPEGWETSLLSMQVTMPVDSHAFGNCELVIHTDTVPLTVRFDRASPTATVRLPITSRRFSIEITEGGAGPIQDRLVLRRAVLIRSTSDR